MQYFVFSLKGPQNLLKVASLVLKPPVFLPDRVNDCTASIALCVQFVCAQNLAGWNFKAFHPQSLAEGTKGKIQISEV